MNHIKPNSTFNEVLVAMKFDKHTSLPSGFAVVVGEKGKVVGVISDSDIRRAVLNTKQSKLKLKAKDLMQKNFIYMLEDELNTQNFSRLNAMIASRKIDNVFSIQFIPILDKKLRHVRTVLMSDVFENWQNETEELIVIGLGYVGLILALSFADKGKKVIGIDVDKKTIDNLKNFQSHIYEPGIEVLMKKTLGKNFIVEHSLSNFSNHKSLKNKSYIICVGTPIKNGKVDKTQLLKTIDFLSVNLNKGDSIILRSTVPIGFSRETADQIASRTGLVPGIDFYFGYAPERTIEGNAIVECSTVPQIYSGYTDACSYKISKVFSTISRLEIKCESLEACELGKLMTNAYRDVIFGFSNEMALIADKYNLDINKLVGDVNSGYNRNQIKKPSPGVGGPCLSKDSYILSSGNIKNYKVINSARVVNEAMPEHVAQILVNHAKENKIRKILIIGLAFKGDPETKDLRNSPSIKILDILLKKNYDIRVYDNIVTKKDINQRLLPLFYSQNDEWYPEMVCVLNNHQDNYNTVNKILNFVKQITLFDPWYICTALYDDKRIKFIKTLSMTWVK